METTMACKFAKLPLERKKKKSWSFRFFLGIDLCRKLHKLTWSSSASFSLTKNRLLRQVTRRSSSSYRSMNELGTKWAHLSTSKIVTSFERELKRASAKVRDVRICCCGGDWVSCSRISRFVWHLSDSLKRARKKRKETLLRFGVWFPFKSRAKEVKLPWLTESCSWLEGEANSQCQGLRQIYNISLSHPVKITRFPTFAYLLIHPYVLHKVCVLGEWQMSFVSMHLSIHSAHVSKSGSDSHTLDVVILD